MSKYPKTLGNRLLEIACREAESSALIYTEGTYTYQNLLETVFSWLMIFDRLGLKKQDRVAFFNDKSLSGYSGILACNLFGLIYSNLDPKNSFERNEAIKLKYAPTVVFNLYDNTLELSGMINQQPFQHHKLSNNEKKLIYKSLDSRLEKISSDDVAYVMFTSGSTGSPKGVAISHRSVLNFIDWVRDTYNITPQTKFAGINALHFDNSVFDLYGSIYNGASLIPISNDLLNSPLDTINTLQSNKANIWFSVPSYLIFCMRMKAIKPKRFMSFTKIIFGGEGFPKNNLSKLKSLLPEHVELFNVYGPTEGTCICSSHCVNDYDFVNESEFCTLGNIAKNFNYKFINKDERGIGELMIGGDQLALGYFNDHELTEQKFIYDYSLPIIQRYYLTGDLMRETSHGLYFHGRKDFQIKHMGYRIELEEIEAVFNLSNLFIETTAVYQTQGEFGKIILHVVLISNKTQKSEVEIIAKKLPVYMRPHHVCYHKSLPKNQNGKIDRKVLKGQI